MAEIDRRALQGLCSYSWLRHEPKGRMRRGGKITQVWCSRPLSSTDELLCDEHAHAIRFSEHADADAARIRHNAKQREKRAPDRRPARVWARRVHFQVGAMAACRNLRTRSVVADVARVTCRKCLAVVNP